MVTAPLPEPPPGTAPDLRRLQFTGKVGIARNGTSPY